MIDENETYRLFGYFSYNLTLKAHKRIIAICDECGKIREIYKHGYSSLCGSCAKKGSKHPNYGKERSEEIRRKISKATKGERNWGYGKPLSAEHKRKLSKSQKGRIHNKETLEKMSESLKGNKNPNWRGGISFGVYCPKFNECFKEYIRAKFGRVCYLCGKTEAENGRKLSVHHVNYQKSCGCADTEENKKADDKACQFVPLCISCNSKVNKDRDKWEKHIKNKLRNKLNGWYI